VRRVPAGTSPSGMHGPIPVLSIVEHALIRARPYVFGQAALGVAPVAHPTAMAAMRALSGSVASRSAPGPHLKTVDAPRHVTHRAALARSMMLPPSPPGRPGARGVATAAAPSAGAGDGAGEQERVFDTEEGPQDRAMGIWLLGVSGMVRAHPRSAPLCAPAVPCAPRVAQRARHAGRRDGRARGPDASHGLRSIDDQVASALGDAADDAGARAPRDPHSIALSRAVAVWGDRASGRRRSGRRSLRNSRPSRSERPPTGPAWCDGVRGPNPSKSLTETTAIGIR